MDSVENELINLFPDLPPNSPLITYINGLSDEEYEEKISYIENFLVNFTEEEAEKLIKNH